MINLTIHKTKYILSTSSLFSILTILAILTYFSKFKSCNNLTLLNSHYSTSVFNLSILSIFFLVCFPNSISSSILFGLPQNLFLMFQTLGFLVTIPVHHFFSNSFSLLFISKSLTILISLIFFNIFFKISKELIKSRPFTSFFTAQFCFYFFLNFCFD